jgi:peptidyl-prolyl cis-trans isomerase SurA
MLNITSIKGLKGLMRRALNGLLLTILLVPVAVGQARQATGSEVVDKMIATVNGSLITYSDLLWQLALQPDTPLDTPRVEDLSRSLNLLIDQRLILQEAAKLPTIAPNHAEVETALADLLRHVPSQADFQQRVRRVGLTAEQLREIVRQRVEIEKYLDFRFRSFTVVSPQEVADYYHDVYVPRFRQRTRGHIVPKLEAARGESNGL